MSETKYVVTCDFEFAPHGASDLSALPQDVFSRKEAQETATAHRREFPTHKSFRVWQFNHRIGRLS